MQYRHRFLSYENTAYRQDCSSARAPLSWLDQPHHYQDRRTSIMVVRVPARPHRNNPQPHPWLPGVTVPPVTTFGHSFSRKSYITETIAIVIVFAFLLSIFLSFHKLVIFLRHTLCAALSGYGIPSNREIRPATFHHTSLAGRLLRSYGRTSQKNFTETLRET